MTNLPPSDFLVNTLRAANAHTNDHFCQCGKFCPNGNACMPLVGEIESPYTAIAEKTNIRGIRYWAAFSHDPNADKAFIHNNQWYDSPCRAADAALRIAQHNGYQLRLDKADRHGELTIDIAILERKLATDLYKQGYDAYLDQQPIGQNPHPLTTMGYNAARNETTAVIAENAPFGVDDGFIPSDDVVVTA